MSLVFKERSRRGNKLQTSGEGEIKLVSSCVQLVAHSLHSSNHRLSIRAGSLQTVSPIFSRLPDFNRLEQTSRGGNEGEKETKNLMIISSGPVNHVSCSGFTLQGLTERSQVQLLQPARQFTRQAAGGLRGHRDSSNQTKNY
ncbi:unnamed protein product [Pleuronectes platessa]|uniref:Uncharacterized protein n=1 Tax=Pleuronectes platessa TaxID=8262 RepID=A0A9N7YV09_PLEPL|nr:unnamed protein product [Pleuronectes platessa]